MGRRLLPAYKKAVEEFELICQQLTEEQLDWSLAPGKWTIWEQITHILDTEIVGSYRLRKTMAEDKPLLMVYDQNAWVDKLDYNGFELKDAANLLRALNTYNQALLANCYPKQCEKVAIHEEKGKISVGDILDHHADHIAHHVSQIKRILENRQN